MNPSNVMRPRPPLASLCYSTEVDEEDFPARSAWKEVQGEIDRHLEDAVKTPGVTALSLTSHPATGKSTTLMRHIAELALASKAPRLVLYVVATEIEAQFISSWLMAHEALDTGAGVGGLRGVQVVTTEAMVRMFTEERACWPSHLTIVLDINWYPSVDDEMALALLLRRAGEIKGYDASQGIHMAIVLLMSGFESARTIQAFRKRLGSISQIKLATHHRYTRLAHLEGDWKKNVRRSIDRWHGRGRVVIGARQFDVCEWKGLELGLPSIVPEPQDPTISAEYTLQTNLWALVEDGALGAHGQVPFALPLTNVSLVVCTGEIGPVARFDPALMQTVVYNRRMMLPEILRVFSWGVRSDQYSSGGVVFAAPAADYPDLELGAEPERDDLGAAWNRDLFFLVLKVYKVWPGLKEDQLPIRSPVDVYVLADRIRALSVLGCLEEEGEGWKCTELGLQILRLRSEMGLTLGFHVAFMLSRVVLMRRHSHASRLVVHVLIHLAAIAHVGSSQFFTIKQPIDREALVRCFPRVIPEKKWCAGSLWTGLGLYLFGHRHSLFSDTEESELEDTFPKIDGVEVNIDMGDTIVLLIRNFAGHVGVTLDQDNDWNMASLTEAEIETIDRELMWAWLHRTAMFWPTPFPEKYDIVNDMVSLAEFRISMDEEVIDVSGVREESAKENEGGGAFYAIYEALVETDNGDDPRTRYQCQEVTWIPGATFEDVKEKSTYLWPDAVGRVFVR
ncbi:hypothetical protein FHL15_004889 [Xylaria flabelliformis]|uniref:Uncharacterized protein n=1 Tax=Xylaria flabelliformis TaxID=2512241 RepID=A0A553I1Q6_9PEZI|nr:hypothetical protein FHL15_004889 [Xylaria flabelliformis]